MDGEGWLWIKAYNAQKDGKHATANLSEHYEVSGKFNEHVAWATANIDNAHFTSDHMYSFEKSSTVSQYTFTILNNNIDNHSENQMVRKMLDKIKMLNDLEMDICKRI